MISLENPTILSWEVEFGEEDEIVEDFSPNCKKFNSLSEALNVSAITAVPKETESTIGST